MEIIVNHLDLFDNVLLFEDENHKQMHQDQFVQESMIIHLKSKYIYIYQFDRIRKLKPTCRKLFIPVDN